MNKSENFRKLPGVIAFKRGHVVSDALMFNEMPSEEGGENETPVEVIRHGIRGTQNVTGGENHEVSNIQITETAKLNIKTNKMIVRFNVAFLPLKDTLNACSGTDKEESQGVRESIKSFLEHAVRSDGLREVTCRYARNIANGRWLWRNRTIASSVRINVMIGDSETGKQTSIAKFNNALEIPLNSFDDYNADEIKLADEIASQMRGDSFKSLVVEASITLRIQGAEVFPSQNYIEKKPKGFARSLYKIGHPNPVNENNIRVMGQAAIRDQKIFNAIRTIDTWYPDFKEEGFPISVEPKGANLNMQEFYRNGKSSSFELFKKLNLINPNTEDGMYCIASFDRGGVYSESEKGEKKDLGKKEKKEKEKKDASSILL